MTFLLFEINCQQILDLLTFCHPLPVKTKNLSSPTLSLLSKPYLSPGSCWSRKIQKSLMYFFFLTFLLCLPHPAPHPIYYQVLLLLSFKLTLNLFISIILSLCQVTIISQFDHYSCLVKYLYISFHPLLQLFSVVRIIFLKCKT